MQNPPKVSPASNHGTSNVASKDELEKIRHSASHVLAQAMQKLFPNVKLGTGPAISAGFYYDFELEKPLTDEDLAVIEKECKRILAESQGFEQNFWDRNEAIDYFKKRGERFKCEIIEGIPDEKISIYKNGPFVDLCRGPHVENTRQIKGFKLTNVAGAYWRGVESNPMLQRVYGVAFASDKDLEDYLKQLEEAKKRDHRKIGRELDLFSFHDESPGMPFYHPKGIIIYNELIRFWREEHEKEGYTEIKTPIMLKDDLWKQSGHYDHYKDNMYFTKVEERDYAIRPMNCPGATLVYRSAQRSYRDLPMRLAELGLVHRHELSGVLHGLFRVKAFTIDDTHIFCLAEQIKEEISSVIALILKIYRTFGFSKIQIGLSTRPKDSMGTDEQWEKATQALKEALATNQISYDVHIGSGAFYGPKIDFEVTDSIGRVWQCGTIQLDFQMPERFGLEYIGEDGTAHRPVMVHRAVFGSIERFLGILVEHYAGAFPVWLAPVQVRVCAISEKHAEEAAKIQKLFSEDGIRCDIDIRAEKINYKVRQGEVEKIPYLAVVGDREVAEGTVSVRGRGRKDLGSMKVQQLKEIVKEKINKKSTE